MEKLFYECSNLTSIDLSKFNTSQVTSMLGIFKGCKKLENINLVNINTSLVNNMQSLFNGCLNLRSIDLSNFDTSKVTTFYWMFKNCKSLNSIDLSNFNTSKLKVMNRTFLDCENLKTINFGNINTSLVENMDLLFYGCSNLISIDLSNFDTSKVTTMIGMFNSCKKLQIINFGNINTSSVKNMRSLFNHCYQLQAINLSNFDTSNVENFQWMFNECKNLKYLNLSNFNTSKVTNIYEMFGNCKSLIYLNLYSFKLYNVLNISNVFRNVDTNNIKICINDNYTKSLLFENNIISECEDSCFNEINKKIDIINNTCIESCKNNGFQYEFNTICHEECPNQTYILSSEEYNDNDSKECVIPELKGYYLDIDKFQKCYKNCNYCHGKGNETYNNCKECIFNYTFYTNPDNIKNCYPICNNYYYFDESNNFTCTTNLKCPENYNKLILNKKKCVNECINDDIYKYEYNNKCYQTCPENTFFNETNNYTCIFKLINNENITQKLITTTSNSEIVYECKNQNTLNNNCNFLNIENEIEILDIIQENMNLLIDPDNGKSQVIKGGSNTIFQITNGKNEKELLLDDLSNNQNITILDLGECENILKKEYGINDTDSLIYLKKENINVKASEKAVQYEIYEPYNFTKLNLSFCKDKKANLYFPLILSDETRKTYENMKSLGYDMFNINDPFYQDLCTLYTSENNTDMPLSARKEYIYENKDSKCQPNCHFSSYLPNSFYINCTCIIEKKEEIEVKEFSGKKLYESFYDVLVYANFKILGCYNNIVNIYIFKKNIGNYIIFVIFALYFICLIFFIRKGIFPLANKVKELISSFQKKNDYNNIIDLNIVQFQNKNQVRYHLKHAEFHLLYRIYLLFFHPVLLKKSMQFFLRHQFFE